MENILICPITKQPFNEPITVPCCGSSYSKQSLKNELSINGNKCPTCFKELINFDIDKCQINKVIDNIIKNIQNSNMSNTNNIDSSNNDFNIYMSQISQHIKELNYKLKALSFNDDFLNEYNLYFKNNFNELFNIIENLKTEFDKMQKINNDKMQKINNDKMEDKIKELNKNHKKEMEDKIKELNKNHKKEMEDKIKELNKDNKNTWKLKKIEKKKNHIQTGFARLLPISKKLANFVGVEPGIELSGPAITKLVWVELKNRGLTWKGDEKKGIRGDQRVLRVDNEVSKIFNIPMSVNKSTDHTNTNGFNFSNLQKYIKNAMID
jgi:hypothetical protein